MAIDTAKKRVSMMNMATDGGSNMVLNFVADGTVAANDRQTMLDCYGGIAWDSPAAGGARLLLINPPGLNGGFDAGPFL